MNRHHDHTIWVGCVENRAQYNLITFMFWLDGFKCIWFTAQHKDEERRVFVLPLCLIRSC